MTSYVNMSSEGWKEEGGNMKLMGEEKSDFSYVVANDNHIY